MPLLLKLAAGATGVYVAIAATMFVTQRRLIYLPDASRVAPATLGLVGVAERLIETGDGARLVTWYRPAPSERPTLVYFHGNAGNLAHRASRIAAFIRAGYGVLMLSYRGYGGSTGRPSERANVADGLRVLDMLAGEGVPDRDVVLYGESLGSGVAVQVAAARRVRAVILDAPFTSLTDVAQRAYPFLPVRPFLLDRYESIKYIRRIAAPLLILHGARDRVVPVALGRALFAAAREPKRLEIFPRAGHSDLFDHGALDVVRDFLEERASADSARDRP